jgi:peptidoglycan-associated lipoprotein
VLPPTQATGGSELPDAGPNDEYQVKFPDEGRGAARYIGLSLGKDLARDCGLVQTHFAFDSSEPLPEDQLVLRSLAQCLDRPGLIHMKLHLVGRTDIRGTDAYNAALGLRRADRVKTLLVAAGMVSSRIDVASKGDRGAVGDDMEYSYGYDRRVDAVVHVTHAPAF